MRKLEIRKQETGNSVQKRRYITGLSMLAAMLVLAGCRQDMHDQPKFFPQRGTDFYADGRSARPQVENTVARGQLREDTYFNTGMTNGAEGNSYPFPVTLDVLKRGQERYNVYCTPCHSRVGNGQGMIVQRGYLPAGNYHTERLRNAPLGHFFNVMTNGYGAMPDYAAQLTPSDRWAVVAYIKALQLSQNASQADIAPGEHTVSLDEIATHNGLPPGFASDWKLPATATAIYGSTTETVAPVAAPAPAAPAPAATTPASAATPTAPAAKTTLAAPAAAPVAPAAKPAQAASSAADIAAGHAIYSANCAVCHQPTLTGMPPMIPAIAGVVQRTSAQHVRSQVINGAPQGKPPMPSFAGKLTTEDIDHLIAYLTTTKAP
jgi:mono/diheme cytochrome c family protein